MTKYNVIFILLDGLRNNRLHLCKNLINISKKSVFFQNMVTAAPYTLSAVHSIVTGLYPSIHGVDSYFNMLKFRNDSCKTLAKYLKDEGYYTESNMVGDTLIPTQGLNKKEVHNEYNDNLTKLHKNIIKNTYNKIEYKNFFLFLQYSNIHTNSVVNFGKKFDDFSKEFFNNYQNNVTKYNSWLSEMDIYVKDIYDYIKKLGLLKNTIVIFFSDHGTSNGEKKGEKMYGSFVYDYTIKVFASMIIPNQKDIEIKYQTRSIDLMPTLLEILMIKEDPVFESIRGKSLVPLIQGEEKDNRIAFSETGGLNGPWPSHNKHNVYCIRTGKIKLIYNISPDTWELYNLEMDPLEKNNIYNEDHLDISELKKLLLNFINNKN